MVDPFSHVILITMTSTNSSAILILRVSELFPGSTAMMLWYQASYSENACNFSGNAFDGKRRKKEGWPNLSYGEVL